jgi:hypothetical protein
MPRTKLMKKTQNNQTSKTRESKNDNVMRMVTPIATGVAVAAGLVAMGSALSDKENRTRLSKQAQKGLDILQNVASNIQEEIPQRYQAVAHQLTPKKQGKKTAKKKQTQ